MRKREISWLNQHGLVIILVIAALLSVMWSCHNQHFYNQPIGKITNVKVIHQQKSHDQFNNIDYQFKQRVRMTVMNGRYQGQTVTANNTYSASGGMDQKYRVGQRVFLTQLRQRHGHLSASVTGLKRDTAVVILIWLVILLLGLILGRTGIFTLLSTVLNILFFLIAVKVDLITQAQYIIPIFTVAALLIAFVTLIVTYGWSKQTLASLLATTLGVGIALSVFLIVSNVTHERGIYYESMQFVTQNYRLIYLAEIMIGCLGAVMDESSDILATMFEVKRLQPHASWHELFVAGQQVGRTVMGPLTNILLMIFLFSTLTNAVLMLRNGNSWGYTFSMTMSLGVAQSLVSGIGIVVTIPAVSSLAALFIARE
ncbi:YibE/F family protein [uncultured Limosilactobacillus sp.]|uniref:YibE/F family protein n=1 Tax=uncultured Limosilactobacillus sp. TaxID=2837629 RepID=UPI0025D0AF33|nr:YibE/F family protein [uncultured Limosilactobacillus sp.]